MLLPFEQKFLKALSRRGVKPNKTLSGLIEAFPDDDIETLLATSRMLIGNGHKVLQPTSETAYLSLLAYYGARADSLGLSGQQVLQNANCFSRTAGMKELPHLSESLVSSLKLETDVVKLKETRE